MVLPNQTTAQTNYDPKATKNVKVNFRRSDQENRWQVTEEERAYAKKCKYPKDLQDFNEDVRFLFFGGEEIVMLQCFDQLRKQLCQGFKSSRKNYLYFDSAWLNGCVYLPYLSFNVVNLCYTEVSTA